MAINAQILDYRIDGESKCFLSKFSLYDYLSNLPENYKEYDVQREVVSTNVYLDKIIDTILNKNHIPSIVIVLEKFSEDSGTLIFNPEDYKIIDGLQRTHRLKIIYDTILFLKEQILTGSGILELKKFELSRKYSKELSEIKSNYKILNKIIDYYTSSEDKDLDNLFKNNFIWFELWTNLNSIKQVEKMLLLNAGHKPVKLKHQLELLFINDLLKEFRQNKKFEDFKLIREKEMNSTSFSKSRDYGEFHFSQLISSLIAFDLGKPLVTNANLISKVQDNDYVIQDLNNELSYSYISDVVEFLLDFDKIIRDNYKNELKWFGRETSLVGLFGALGDYRIKNEIDDPKIIFSKLISFLHEHPKVLNFNTYDESRKILDLSKINYGNVNRRVVYDAFKNLLERIDKPGFFNDEPINWINYFQKYANL